MLEAYALRMPACIYAGENAIDNLAQILAQLQAKRVALFTDRGIHDCGITAPVEAQIRSAGAECVLLTELAVEPLVDEVAETVRTFRALHADLIVAVGGGSVMDAAKLASVLDTDDYTVRDLLEKPQRARKRVRTVMIPTTAGTGAEATPNAIVNVPEWQLKVGIVNADMIADYVILDARNLRALPRHIAASTGLDALAHAIECYTSNKANPFSDLVALEALELIFHNIERACDTDDMRAKGNMLLASFYAGIAITAAGTTAVHALSYPLGGRYHIAHGVSNAILLTPVMRFNAPFITERLARVHDRVWPHDEMAALQEEKAKRVLDKMSQIVRHLDIPRYLDDLGVDATQLDTRVDAGMKVTRLLDNNIRPVRAEDARAIYQSLFKAQQNGGKA